jgi:toxin ParE1/3/4
MRVKWLRKAIINLSTEAEYIAQENPQAASDFIRTVISSVDRLSEFPNIGRPGRVFGTRELVITNFPYIIPYRVKDEAIQILRVFHTSRKWPNNF